MISCHPFVFAYSQCEKLQNTLDFVEMYWTVSEKLFDSVNFG